MWKQLRDSNYEVSDLGDVRNITRGKIVRSFKDEAGYMRIALNVVKGEKKTRFKVHRLVAEVFLENFSTDLEVHHINGIRDDNRVINLACVSRIENVRAIPYVQNKKIIENIISLYLDGKTIDEIITCIR